MINGYGMWAPRYREKLWTGVLPLPPRAKAPVPKGYTGRGGKIPSDGQIEAWCRRWANGNIGLRMPGDVLGIDVDDYEYEYHASDPDTREPLFHPDGTPLLLRGVKTGGTTLAALEAELGPLPPTWRSSSRGDGPSGIRLFRVPSGLLWGDFGEFLEGIWWGHRYAVVYPSVNPDSGLPYQWIDDSAHDPVWGVEPPKVTDLAELPESWTARFGRTADQPKAPKPRPERERSDSSRPAAPRDPGEPRRFTRDAAAKFVQPFLDDLRASPVGAINNRLNDAAKVLSHFVPVFWSPAAAHALLHDALSATAYDGKTWQAQATIDSAMDSAMGDWHAVLVAESPARPARGPVGHEEEPPDDEYPPPPADGMDEAVDGFWDRRPFLRYVHTYARSRYTAPWAVLGSVLAIATASVEPNIQLPAIIGSEASLNLFVGLIGPSGGGKDIAFGVARRLLDVRSGAEPVETDVIPLGSGEGLSHIYMKHPPKITKRRKGDDDEDSQLIGLAASDPDRPVQYRTRAVVTIKEIDTLDAIGQRKGSTLGGQLRQGWSGDQIGFHYVDTTKRMIVPEHAYRLCIVAGIQPGRAQALLSDAESAGGTPQRFLWLPATDPTMSLDAPATPAPVQWSPPQYHGTVTFDVCPEASDVILQEHVKRNRGDGDALDGHALLLRLKIAAALAMLDSRAPRMQCTVTAEDWELSGVVMAVSDRTRAAVQRHLAEAAKEQNKKTAVAEAHRSLVMAETVATTGESKAVKWLRGRIGAEWITGRDLMRAVKSTIREHVGPALDRLVAEGEFEMEEYQPTSGPVAQRYRIRS